MIKFFATLVGVLVVFAVLAYLASKLLARYAAAQERARRASAQNTEDVIEAKRRRIEDELRKEETEAKWQAYRDRFGSH